jgi:hypothetical protein
MSQFDRRRLLTVLAGGVAIASVRGGVTWALMRPEEKRSHEWPHLTAEEWQIEEALIKGDYVVG